MKLGAAGWHSQASRSQASTSPLFAAEPLVLRGNQVLLTCLQPLLSVSTASSPMLAISPSHCTKAVLGSSLVFLLCTLLHTIARVNFQKCKRDQAMPVSKTFMGS